MWYLSNDSTLTLTKRSSASRDLIDSQISTMTRCTTARLRSIYRTHLGMHNVSRTSSRSSREVGLDSSNRPRSVGSKKVTDTANVRNRLAYEVPTGKTTRAMTDIAWLSGEVAMEEATATAV